MSEGENYRPVGEVNLAAKQIIEHSDPEFTGRALEHLSALREMILDYEATPLALAHANAHIIAALLRYNELAIERAGISASQINLTTLGTQLLSQEILKEFQDSGGGDLAMPSDVVYKM